MERPGRRKWTAEQKRRIVEETRAPGASVSVVARRYDITANLLFKWKRLDLAEGDTLEFQVGDLVRCRYIKLRPPEGWSHLGTCLRPVAVERICPS